MPKINDLSDWEKKKNPKTNKKGEILCPDCVKNLAIVTEYGVLRRCLDCQKNHTPSTFHAVIKEGGKNKFY